MWGVDGTTPRRTMAHISVKMVKFQFLRNYTSKLNEIHILLIYMVTHHIGEFQRI